MQATAAGRLELLAGALALAARALELLSLKVARTRTPAICSGRRRRR